MKTHEKITGDIIMPIKVIKSNKSMTVEPSINCPIFDSTITSPMVNSESGCYNLVFGFKLCWDLDIDSRRAVIELKYNDTSEGKWILDTTNTSVQIAWSIGIAGALLEVSTDWTHELKLKGEVDYLGKTKEFDVVIFAW
jgi:hypothetical protein